jgi:hypothetical protein
MGIYPKKLRSVADLEREKKILRARSRKLEDEDFLSLESILGKSKGKEKNSDNEEESSLFDLLPISNPIVKMAVKFIGNRLLKKNDNQQSGLDLSFSTAKKKSKHFARKVAVEFIGGYLKWKAIELTYKGIRHLLNKNKTGEKVLVIAPAAK